MKVWQLDSDLKSIVIMLSNYEEDREKMFFSGEKVINWDQVSFYTSVRGKYHDFPKLTSGIPVLSRKALDVLQEYITDYVQLLPIDHPQELFLVNVHNVLDCIDYERSKFLTMPSGRFGGFTERYFREDMVRNEWIFKIREEINTSVYVTDKFRDIVLNSGLKGFSFIEIWDSEITVEIEQEREQLYQQRLAEIEQHAGEKMNWATASELVEAGKAIASGKWRIQKNKNSRRMLGQLTWDLSYMWIDPVYYPPILLELEWHETELSDI